MQWLTYTAILWYVHAPCMQTQLTILGQRHDPEYQRSEHTVLAEHSAVREDEPQHFEVFLHRKGSKLPFWFMVH